MSPARRSVNPQQEALDLGLPEPAPVKTKPTNKPAKAEAAQSEPVDSESVDSTVVEPARADSTTRADSATRARPRKKDAPLLSDEQLRTTAELTVRDLAAYARGEVSRAELSERAAQRASAPYRKALKTLKHSLGPAAHTMTDDALYELVDIALAARQATQPDVKQSEAHQTEADQPKEPARKAPARKKPAQKKTAQKELTQNEPIPQESETAARAISARPQKVTKASEEGEQKPAPKKNAPKKIEPEAEAEKPALKKTAAKKTAPAEKAPASKASVSKTAAPKTPAKPKTAPKKAPAKKATAERVAADKPASAAAEAKSRALARYASEDRIENAPLKKYLPAPSAKAIATHLDLHTVGEMLEYFPRKYLPRGELSSFAELVEGQDVTIIARVVHVSTRTMAARRGKITEVTITDRLSDATGQDAPAGFGAAGFGAVGLGAGGPVSVVPGRANRPGVSGASRVSGVPAQSWQATGMHNPRINALANSTQNPGAQIPRAQNPAAQNPAQGRGAQPASYSGYADSYGQDSFAQDSFAQDSFAQGGLFGVPAPSMTNPGALIGSQMKLSFFNAWTAAREIREGETMMFSGRVGIYRGEYTLTNPHYALLSKDASGADVTDAATAPVPVYRAPVKLPTDRISGYMAQLLEKVPLKELEDPVPYTIRHARKVPSLEWTYRALHTPDSEDTWRAAQAQMRYREAFVLQSALARLHSVRAAHLTQPRPAVEGGLADQLLQVLPYELTEGQQKVGAEIAADLSSESPMNRLLQGDVGSGKTVVALRAMLQVADAGGQSAMLAPTEVLAEQHLRSVLDILGDMAAPEDSDADDSAAGSAEGIPAGSGAEPGRVRVRLLTASMGTRAKRKVLQELADGTAQIVIGTHALLSDEVSFHDLGLVVVDEQHRFGVEQRDSLRGTGGALPHRLVMTATPIPRTVAMTVFGDLDVSVLDTLPAGRQKISTHVVPLAEKPAWASRLWRRAREEIDAGHQVYVVVPKIGEDGDSLEEGAAFFGASSLNGAGTGAGAGNSAQGYFGQGGSASSDGKVQLTSVASMYSYLSAEDALVGVRIGTLHGRMDPAEKTAAMTAFERGEIDLLISTTVIEVGVNVPNATLMIIMDADRFGISGLHQLRGRVGRGGYAGTCLLVTRQEEGGVSRERLDAVASTTDGFELSRIDLAQRREGDILGTAQSGSKSTLRFLRALADADIIERAREDARSVVEKDPTLAKHPSLARTIDRALDADREAFLGRG
ncbi:MULTISPECIES: ATP-dependent DNA helicase RecG [unclassified Rothia (in: high G+C Gram-positive bacteria)]|uniref:ATP-dependent DNA helicase RecG n=1 Tax=unclassified Rothia (in: high G+C Gram-positive bacteria) TaxID=2689056 RepID=UPI0009F51BAD|nr:MULTISPECIES: DEAD/DEAH box helicase [unclassified Rothia (in: high G+C Gram-positive bacteria)]